MNRPLLPMLAPLMALAFALVAQPARAQPTGIATLPLLSIEGSGTVKPNLMLLYDNSGSMESNYTPDYVASSICRSRATLALGQRACAAGDPPFNSAQFNRQYYNPKVTYKPPVKADGTFYDNLDRRKTSAWTRVPTDVFDVDNRNMRDARETTTNLVTGFPDFQWCSGRDCKRNVRGYTYPDATYNTAEEVFSSPYYYTINVGEYCKDATLTTCVTAGINAPAPPDYPIAATVRWCNSRALTTCQAKNVDTYRYPRFSDQGRAPEWYGTITIANSGSSRAVMIASVRAVGPNGDATITNGQVNATGGTDTDAKRREMANALAKSIVDRTGLERPFTACTNNPSAGVANCRNYGITLASDFVVGVVPLACPATATTKTDCTAANDGSRSGDDLVVTSGSIATALVTITGATANSSNQTTLASLNYNGVRLLTNQSLGRNASATQVAITLRDAIGTRGTMRAYVGRTANTSPECQAAAASTLCLVDLAPSAVGRVVAIGRINNNNSISMSVFNAVGDSVSTAATHLGGEIFMRTDIVETRNSYPKAITRLDCSGDTCSFDEEMTNFANWYGYYKTRNQMMKTSVGHAFQSLGDNYNVGIVALSAAAANTPRINNPLPFTGGNRVTWYNALYGTTTSGSTPVRVALNNIGKLYANKDKLKRPAGDEVVKYACQQNFTFVTTDGYWNGGYATEVGNVDRVADASRFCPAGSGCVDPREQDFASLADVALYWYNGGSNGQPGSLRPELENYGKPGVVPARDGDNRRLHMRTYALGLGVDGIMTYDPNYDKTPTGDFYKLKTGVLEGCPWNGGGAYVWPDPRSEINDSGSYQARVDDLWHAAINGRGKYFSASDPQQVVSGLAEALNDIEQKTGAASAAATSTPNVSQEDNDIFSATFTTVRWTGNLTKRQIDTTTGVVSPEVKWNSGNIVGKKVADASDSRTIYWRDRAGVRRDFVYDQLSATEKGWFDNKCGALSQCAALSPTDRTAVNQGATIVNWLRGQQQYADGVVLRAYHLPAAEEAGADTTVRQVLGDIASSKPAYLRDPRKGYDRPGYAAYKAAHASRTPTVFVGANDGMLHAFDGAKGTEVWAYMPRITMQKLHRQASLTYSGAHQFTTDGSPEIADVRINGEWRAVLVSGLNGGGRGYFALDVTDPADPKPLWELCADQSVCSGASHVPELGLTFGNPQFGTIKDGDNERWVVFLTSGYNNIPGADSTPGGTGQGFLFVVDVATGEVIKNLGVTAAMSGGVLATGAGDTNTPSGFAKITAITSNPNLDPLVTYVYGGDILGNMWRFDFTGEKVIRSLMGSAGTLQPITTRPDVALCQVDASVQGNPANGLERVVAFGTGRMLDLPDIGNDDLQSAYVLRDTGRSIGAGDWRNASGFTERTLVETRAPNPDVEGDEGSNLFRLTGNDVDLSRETGWFVDFDQNKGERVNLDPKIVSGTLSVVTNVPSSSTACSVGGISYAYHFDVCTGRAVAGDIAGGLLSNNSAAVGFIIVRLPSGALKMITTTAKGDTITTEVAPAKTREARRTGWRRVRD